MYRASAVKNDGLLGYYAVQQNVCSGVSEALSLSLSLSFHIQGH
jgi:hypothetical protein